MESNRRQSHFVNLTNGIEWVPELSSFSFVRLESTAIEKDDWTRVFNGLDDNFLMCLALGHDCHFYDCGAGRETSKTVSVGVPRVRAFCSEMWFGTWNLRADTDLLRALKRKYGYFRRFLNTDKILLTGHSKATSMDGDKAYYRGLALATCTA